MEPKTYADVLAANFRAARARIGLSQETTAARMRALGFGGWRYQTVGVVENGRRKLSAEEVMALAWVLELSISALMSPAAEDGDVRLPSGDRISARSVAMLAIAYNDRSVAWDGADPEFRPDDGEVTVQVLVRPRALFAHSPTDPAFGDGRAPLTAGHTGPAGKQKD
jgi:transcriptional regulator with XRE-family HTH domain